MARPMSVEDSTPTAPGAPIAGVARAREAGAPASAEPAAGGRGAEDHEATEAGLPPAESAPRPPRRAPRKKRPARRRVAVVDPEATFGGATPGECRRVARERFGIRHLHPEQTEAFQAALAGRDTLVVLPTGYGKSLIYQVLAMLAKRPVVTLFPLIALMQDQERALLARGIPVVRLDSTLGKRDRDAALARLEAGGRLIVLTTPETLESSDVRRVFETTRPALLCIDEAHCISEWGHDFRPAYLRVGLERVALGNPQILALTATATPRVQADLMERLGMSDAALISAPPHRANLRLSARVVYGNLKFGVAGKLLRRLTRPGIVYCATTKAVDEIYAALRRARIPAVRYHGKMTKAERLMAQKRFTRRGPRLVMVATTAFGMGIDKPNIRYILHYQVPGSIEQYVQEAGRAGRDGRPSECIVLFDPLDLDIQKHLNERSHASFGQLRRIGRSLSAWLVNERSAEVQDLALGAEVPVTTCRAICGQLEEAGLIERDAGKRYHARVDPEALIDGIEDLATRLDTKQRQDARRLQAMAEYAGSDECRSVFIRRWFGEEDPPRCARCDRCRRLAEGQRAVIGKKKTKRRRRPARSSKPSAAGASATAPGGEEAPPAATGRRPSP